MTVLPSLPGQTALRSLAARAGDALDMTGATLRLTRDLPCFVRTPLTLGGARAELRRCLETREQRFLAAVFTTIFRHPRSPYLALLRMAGCEHGDLTKLVMQSGVEEALRTLAGRGVYVTFDEFKGRREIVRGSQRHRVRQADFDNPWIAPHLIRFTSGSGGRPSRVRCSLALAEEWARATLLVQDAHAIDNPRHAFWWPIPVHWQIAAARLRQPVLRWLYPAASVPLPVQLVSGQIAALARLSGWRAPRPEPLDLLSPEPLVRWLAHQLHGGRPLMLWTTASAGTRVALAATRLGVDLRGLTILLGGEATTPTRRRHIEDAGAGVIAQYGSVELSTTSFSCATPTATDDLHVMLDRFAIVGRQRPTTSDAAPVDALLFSTLELAAPKIALNVELGDYGRLETRDCGCDLGALGLRTHLAGIRSFEKLTGEGVTFTALDLTRILEVSLPARFGGSGLDYQLAEQEDGNGLPRLVLRASPSIGALDASQVRAALLDEIGRPSPADRHQAALWRSVGSLIVRREYPRASRSGKMPAFLPLRPGAGELHVPGEGSA